MSDRRFQVFVSSTYLDLKEERAAVISALLQSDAIPAGMELFPAADETAWSLIKKVIDECDYYLLVIGGKYGSVDEESDLSYTEKEYDYAVAQKKPVMAFLHGEPDEIPVKKSEKTEEAQKKLEAFRIKVKETKHVKFWTAGPADLAGQVALSFNFFKQNYAAEGWIRGGAETSAESLAELNDLRKTVAEMRTQLETARTEPPAGADELAQGDEKAGFKGEFIVTARTESMERWDDKGFGGSVELDNTWDELFSQVGPELFDEASEAQLAKRIETSLTAEYRDEAKDRVRDAADKRGDPVEAFKRTRVSLSDDDFGTLIVQFRALGLIQKGERARSVKDKGTYWSLTPYGEEHLTSLRAIKRP